MKNFPLNHVLPAFLAAVILTGGATVALAIPSPELLVSSVSSLSQLWGLAGAAAGGGALILGARTGSTGQSEKQLRRLLTVSWLVALCAVALNVAQFWNNRSSEAKRLEATLLRPTMKGADGAALDPLLKEMPYGAQLKSSQGIPTDEVARLLPEMLAGKHPEIIALDIRETAETEQGVMPGTRSIRFPDLPQSQIDFTGKTALLFCHNGNRSAETCAALKARGVDCKFMVGGFEKWLVEGHQLSGSKARTLADLRAIASYPNQAVLLDTPTVVHLLTQEKAIIVDVRYPGEFAASSLPGAINIPFRPTPTADLARALDGLPAAPVIAPCYDRRSCFFADVLGLELSRRGRDFRGRYTVPWEYFVPSTPPPHVAQWLASTQQTTWSQAADGLTVALEKASAHIGFLGALLALAALSRLLVFPFAAKADRDQAVARQIAPQIADLKTRFADDPQRLGRALRHLMARHGLTPARNLVALLFLPVLALSIEAVIRAAKTMPHAVPLIADLTVPDPTYVLAATFGLLLTGYLDLAMATTPRRRLAIWAVGFPLLSALAAVMPASGALYMVASAALLLVQRFATMGMWQALTLRVRRVRIGLYRLTLREPGLVSLGDVQRLGSAGNKAHRLAVMAEIGIPVPRGVVLTGPFLERYRRADVKTRTRLARRIAVHVGRNRLAVRSSAGAEDGADHSFAGVFETVLDVDRAGLAAAIERVAQSFHAARAASYASDSGMANILIQPMVAARHAGVLFTQDPIVPGCTLIEWVAGTGENLVSGRVTPARSRIGRVTGLPLEQVSAPFDFAPLMALSRRIERTFGKPQDIEWAHDGRRFVILQSRDIVAPPPGGQAHIADEWCRLAHLALPKLGTARHGSRRVPSGKVADTVVLAQDGMAEMLPRPTPASLSLLHTLWESGGSVDRAARSLGFTAPGFDGDAPDARPLHTTAFGVLYADQREAASRAQRLSVAAARRLRTSAHTLESEVRRDVLPAIVARSRRLWALDPGKLATGDLMALFIETYRQLVDETHVAVDRVNIAAQFYLDEAQAALAQAGCDPVIALADIPETGLAKSLRRLPPSSTSENIPSLMALLGHRAATDYELSTPRYGEDLTHLQRAMSLLSHTAHSEPGPDGGAMSEKLRPLVSRAQRFITLKEDAKHESLREVALLRRWMRAIDHRYRLEGNIWFLTLPEISTLSPDTVTRLAVLAGNRQVRHDAFKTVRLPHTALSARVIECGPLVQARARTQRGGALMGTRVSGKGATEGRAVCVDRSTTESGAPIPDFEAGDIIVARALHPAWLPELMRAGGVVVEVGGFLSHMAILARERGVTMSVGVQGLDAVRTGTRIRLEPDGSVVCL